MFGNFGTDGSFWSLILEKAHAKVSGNYENTEGGIHGEAMRILLGSPTTRNDILNSETDERMSPSDAFDKIK